MTMDNLPAEQPELTPALIGRDAEMELLGRKMDEVSQGMGAVVVVSGEAGMGKTRLMEEAERQARERDLLFLRGAGDSRRAGLAYGVFVEELNVYLEYVSAEERTQLREAVAELAPHLWNSLFPTEEAPEPAEPDMNPQLRQALFLARLGRLLLNLALRQPLILCLEDLHWADSASLYLLSLLVSRNVDVPLMILGTCRPERQEGGEGPDLEKILRELQLKRHVHVLALQPLDRDGTRAMVTSCFKRQGLSELLIEWLHRKSGGVPLFVMQYLEFLLEKGVVHEKDGLWVDCPLKEQQEPDSIRAVLRQRLQRLDPEERQILSYASVQGDRFEGGLVARTMGLPLNGVMRVLGEMMRRTRLVRTEERKFCFVHSLLTEVFYDQLPDEKRRWAHMRLGSILEERGLEDAEVLAYHFYHAGGLARALPYLLESARRTRAAHAFREARRFLVQAEASIKGLDAATVQPQHLEMLLLLADIEDRTGNPDRTLEICRQMLQVADPREDRAAVARALIQMGVVLSRRGEWEEAIRVYWGAQSICAELGDEQESAKVYVRLGNIALERSRLEAAEMHYKKAKEVAVKEANYPLLGTVYGNLGIVATVRGQYLEAVLGYTEAIKAYSRINHSYGLCQTYHNLGMAHGAQQEWEEALNCYARGWGLAREMGTIDVEANILVSQAVAQIGVGDLEGAEISCQQARAHMEQLGDRLGLAECDKVEGMIHRERSQYPQAEKQLQQGRHRFNELENLLGVAECDLELGRLFQDRGELETARQRLEESQRLFQEIGAEADARRAEELLAALVS